MTDADHPTASSRPHVVDMFHAALTTLPHGGAGNSEPQADADLAIDPKLGSRIGSAMNTAATKARTAPPLSWSASCASPSSAPPPA